MATYKRPRPEGPSSEDKALDLFAEMMIEKIESIREDWKKPWFTEGSLQWPRNLSGREYNGMNALMLLIHCEKEGYAIPRFCTFDCVQRLNKPDKDGKELPRVSVLRGEKSFPVMLTTFTCIHKETKEKIKYDDYKKLSENEQKEYNVYPKMQVFRVFNVAQTNLQEARPELWQKLEKEYVQPKIENGEHFSFAPVDTMIKDNLWICPIKPLYQDSAYYSITRNEIVVPEKRQFESGEAFYGTLFHEMTHSTGAEGVLDRIKPTSFGSEEYAREELVAELGSALVAQRYGMGKHIKEDSCAYLKNWLDELKESPQFIKTTLLDVKRATSLITQKVDKIAQEQKQQVGEEQEAAPKEKIFYSSVAYLQYTDDTARLDAFRDKGDYEGLLTLAKEYYDGNGMDEKDTYASPLQNRGDDLLIEDKDFAVVYNGSVGGTYEVMLKFTEQEVRDHITRYGIDRASNDVREVARDMAAEQFTAMAQQKIPAFEMPNGEVLYVGYNRESDSLDVGQAVNAGLAARHSFPYDHNATLEANLQTVNEKLNGMEEYQEELQEAEYSGGMRR
ncbi:MAG: zincin-like metallopeptidase domain-containing protein [Alistipes putredinis]|uniref:zincin-like metallopeptidase domain-containing protein n=1 Tax=Bacteroidales TaxID=171549 RepID=UPI001105B884|nr:MULTISPECIES: zincin-like metallopeptidase domain-containing protein [Bacteroidaceae]MCE9164034.1 ssDNA-binding domain-containing protein [Bacteroides ovatus]MDB1090526.1 zincin-like metallopeptidase domain-containing protein [Phocaeicola vulgatus]